MSSLSIRLDHLSIVYSFVPWGNWSHLLNIASIRLSRPSFPVWMDKKKIVVDLANRAAVISKPWLFVDSIVVLLVFLLTHLSLIPIAFLRFLQDIVEHVNMFHYSEDIVGTDHKFIPVFGLKPFLWGWFLSILCLPFRFSPRSFLHCFVNSKPIVFYLGGNGCRLSCQYGTDLVLPYV